MVKTLLRGQKSYERRTALTARYEQLAGVESDIAYIQVGSLLGQLSQLAVWPNLRQLGTPPNDGRLSDAARAICRFLVEGGGAVDGKVEAAEAAWARIEDAFGPRAGPSIQREAMSAHQEFASAWRSWWGPTMDGRSQQ